MADEPRTLDFGVTYDMVAAQSACGQCLSLTSHRGGDRIPPHRHTNDYVCIVMHGGFSEVVGNHCVERNAGTFFAYHIGETHHDCFGSRGATCLNLHFSPGDPRPTRLEGRCAIPVRLAADQIAFELTRGISEELVLASLAAEIMAELSLGEYPLREPGKWIERIVEAVCDEPCRRWSLSDLAGIADRHPVRVAQAFRARTGISLGAYQRRRRLVHLSLALRNGKGSLADLASDFGYCDQAHMNAEFRTAFGTSPGRYRRLRH